MSKMKQWFKQGIDMVKSLLLTVIIIGIISCSITSIILSGLNYIGRNKPEYDYFMVMNKSETEEFIFESGFGFKRCIEKGEEPTEIIVNTYNEKAGNIDNWNNGISLNEYNTYSNSINSVNGNIVHTEIYDEYMEYTYANGKILRVNFIKTDDISEYTLTKDSNYNYKISEDGNYIKYTYENGYVEIVQLTQGIKDKVIAVDFSGKNLIKDLAILSSLGVAGFTAILIIIAFIIMPVLERVISNSGRKDSKENG